MANGKVKVDRHSTLFSPITIYSDINLFGQKNKNPMKRMPTF